MGLKQTLAALLDTHPRLYLPAVRLFAAGKYDGSIVGPHTELVISGYPRSANSFATMSVYEAHERPIAIGSHLHAAAEVIEAVRLGLPTVVLVRRPEDAIRSLKAAMPGIDENRELERWIRFYTRIEPLHERYAISPFERTIGDWGGVIDEVNARFGTSFERLEPTEENRARVIQRVRQDQERFGTQQLDAAPDAGRDRRLRDVRLDFDSRQLARATKLRERFEELSGWRPA